MANDLIIKKTRPDRLGEDVQYLFDLLDVPRRVGPVNPVIIKPNIFSPESAEVGATTDLQLLGEVIDYFKNVRKDVLVVEAGANQYAQTGMFENLGTAKFCAERGAEFVNLNQANSQPIELTVAGRRHQFRVPTLLLEPHYLVDLPKFKTHLSTRVSWAIKNLYGLLPDKEKWFGHRIGIHQMLIALSQRFHADVVLTDGIVAMKGMGPTMGLPERKNLLFAAPDQFVHDVGLLRLLDIKHVAHIEQCTDGKPLQISYLFLDEDGCPVDVEALGVELYVPSRLLSMCFIRTNQVFFTLAPWMDKFFNPKTILNFMVNRHLVRFVRNAQRVFRI